MGEVESLDISICAHNCSVDIYIIEYFPVKKESIENIRMCLDGRMF